MLILALDTTTRAGSLAVVCDGSVLETFVGDAERTHATRLPGDILDCLARHRLGLKDIDVYGVAAGPGSFTGLRIGIATVQGLAFANGRPVVGVSALDALAESCPTSDGNPRLRAAWMDAQRGEVYACLYRAADTGWVEAAAPVVERPEAVLATWDALAAGEATTFVGDGALTYGAVIELVLGQRADIVRPVPSIAPAIAKLAGQRAAAGHAGPPHAIRPVYIRRPDAELARDRRAAQAC
jgi:tRNA threonylcarbamoyladenosine biosynthesis protein TsaB